MSKWNFVAMGQVGLTGWTREVAKPVARSVARRTGRPEAEILSLIGAAFLATTLIDFIRMLTPSSLRDEPGVPANDPPGSKRLGDKPVVIEFASGDHLSPPMIECLVAGWASRSRADGPAVPGRSDRNGS